MLYYRNLLISNNIVILGSTMLSKSTKTIFQKMSCAYIENLQDVVLEGYKY